MAQSGLKSGLQRGIHQGVKSGLTLAPLKSGMISGRKENITNKDKFQNPQYLSGIKKPLAFINADNIALTATETVFNTVISNLISGYNDAYETNIAQWTAALGTNVYIDPLLNNKRSVNISNVPSGQTEGMSTTLPAQAFGNTSAGSFTTIFKPVSFGPNGKITIFNRGSESLLTSKLECSIESGNFVKVLFTDPVTSATTIVYQSLPGSIVFNRYNMITVTIDSKIGMNGTTILNNPIKIYINGKLNSNYTSGTCNGLTNDWSSGQVYFGNNSSNSNYGGFLAAALASEYVYSDIERIRIENYFRWYYGNKF